MKTHWATGVGFFGIPGRTGGQTHAVRQGQPLCGQRLDPRAQYQFCANDLVLAYVECRKCLKKLKRP